MSARPIILASPHGDGAKLEPQSYLGPLFNAYRQAVSAAGARYVPSLRANVITIDRLGDVRANLADAGMDLAIHDDLRSSIERAADVARSFAEAGALRLAEAERRLAGTGLALFPYQRDGVRWLAVRRNGLLADSMGLGKTIQVLVALPERAAAIVVAPAAVVANWLRETRKWRPDLRPSYITGRTSWRWPQPGEIVLTTYGSLPAEDQELTLPPANVYLIADEAHMLKGTKGKRQEDGTWRGGVQRVRRWFGIRNVIAQADGFTWLLTGTPLINRPPELWRVLQAAGIAEEAFGSYPRFTELVGGHRGRHGMIYDGPMSDDLPLALQKVSLRRDLETVLPDLPHKRRQVDTVEIADAEAIRLCNLVESKLAEHGYSVDVLADMSKMAKDVREVIFELLSKVRASLAAAKIPALLEVIETYEEEEIPAVVFSAHLAPLKALASRTGWALIDGSVDPETRAQTVEAFQAGQLRGIACSYAAGGVGITLTRAHHVVCVDLPWTPALLQQAEDRCILEGQPILTPDGWRPVEQVKIGDLVIAQDGQPHRVLNVWSRGCLKPITELRVEGWTGPLRTTSDHLYLLPAGEWREAGQLRPGDRLAVPNAQPHRTGRIAAVGFDSDCRRPQQFVGAGGRQRNARLLRAPDVVELTEDALFTFGYFLGDGFASTTAGKGRFLSFAGHQVKDRDSLARCARWSQAQGMNLHERRGPGLGVEVRSFSAEWALWFSKHFGRTCRNKRLPEWATTLLAPDQARTILSGLVASDGYRRRGHVEYTTVSHALAAGVARLAIAAGFAPTVQHRGAYRIGWAESGKGTAGTVLEVRHRFPKKRPRRERVYDLMVEGDPSFTVGLSVVHNCRRIGQTADSVHVRILAADHAVDHRVAEIIVEKTVLIERTVEASAVEHVTVDDRVHRQAEALATLANETTDVSTRLVAEQQARREESARLAAQYTERARGEFTVGMIEPRGKFRGPETPAECHAARALIILAGLDPDHAREKNDAGFNATDGEFGHSLADNLLQYGRLSDRQWEYAVKIVAKYHRQVGTPC